MERLDRFLFTPNCLDLYPHLFVETLTISSSDHTSIFVTIEKRIPIRGKPFRFEAMWLYEGACDLTFANAWSCCFLNSSSLVVSIKLVRIRTDLLIWNRCVWSRSTTHFSSLKGSFSNSEFDSLKNPNLPVRELTEKELEIGVELEKWYKREEIFWAQKSRQMWMLQGDRNTTYFHNVVRKRRAQNKIYKICSPDGVWIEE